MTTVVFECHLCGAQASAQNVLGSCNDSGSAHMWIAYNWDGAEKWIDRNTGKEIKEHPFTVEDEVK